MKNLIARSGIKCGDSIVAVLSSGKEISGTFSGYLPGGEVARIVHDKLGVWSVDVTNIEAILVENVAEKNI